MRKFRKTYIEITNACNLACEFCPGTSRPAQYMDRESFRKVIAACKDYSQLIHFHVYGEPTLHPEIGLFLDDCLEFELKVHIVTNGLLLNKMSGQLVGKKALRSISVSLQSMCNRETMVDFDEYLRSLHSFTDRMSASGGPWITLRLWNFGDENVSLPNDMVLDKIASEFSFDKAVYNSLNEGRGFQLKDNLYINTAGRFEWPDLHGKDCNEHGHCLGLRDQIAILVDGTVVPCCLDIQGVVALGNIFQNSLDSVLSSKRAIAIRDGFSHGIIREPLCRKCSYRLRFAK